MTLALDTNVFIDLMRGKNPEIRMRYALALSNNNDLVTSLVVYHELHFGAAISNNADAQKKAVADVLRDVTVEPLTETDMECAAMIRAMLRSQGRPIGPYDALIAGQAMARAWKLVTSNVGEFRRLPIKVIDWSVPR